MSWGPCPSRICPTPQHTCLSGGQDQLMCPEFTFLQPFILHPCLSHWITEVVLSPWAPRGGSFPASSVPWEALLHPCPGSWPLAPTHGVPSRGNLPANLPSVCFISSQNLSGNPWEASWVGSCCLRKSNRRLICLGRREPGIPAHARGAFLFNLSLCWQMVKICPLMAS